MNSLAILFFVVAIVALLGRADSLSLGRGRGGRASRGRNLDRAIAATQIGEQVVAGGEEAALSQSSLKAGERNLDALQALLEKKQARDARIAKKNERKERKLEKSRAAEGDKLQAEEGLKFETYEKDEKFHNKKADAELDIHNRFSLAIQSDNKHQEAASIDEAEGSRYGSGTKLQKEAAVDEQSFANADQHFENEFFDANNLEAAENEQDVLNAQEESKVENEAQLEQSSLDKKQGSGFSDNIFDSGTGFDSSFFGGFDSVFKRK